MNAAQDERITRIGPDTPCGQLLRRYWQPAALTAEFNAALDPRMALRPVKAVRLLGQDLVLFKDASGTLGLLDRDCAHRGANLSFGRLEPAAAGGGLRCPFHGWKFAPDGRCLETPAEPPLNGMPSRLCERIRQRSYPVQEQGGVLFAWLGDEGSEPPLLPTSLGPALDALDADTALSHAMGLEFVRCFSHVKRFEAARSAASPDPAQWARREYFGRI